MSTESPNSLPEPLAAKYVTSVANEGIALYSGDMQVRLMGQEWNGPGEISLAWLPEPRLYFEMQLPVPLGENYRPERTTLALVGLSVSTEVEITGATVDLTKTQDPTTLRGEPNAIRLGQETEVRRIDFHLPNFPSYLGEPTALREEGYSLNRCGLESAEWKVTLDQVPDIQTLLRDIRGVGGYGITHVGRLERSNGEPISVSDAYDVFGALSDYFSIVRQRWTGPLLLRGIDETGNVAWEDWTVLWQLHPWSKKDTSLCRVHPKDLDQFFRHFMESWDAEFLNDVIDIVSRSLLEARAQDSARMGLVLAQTGLELMAWAILGELRGSLKASFQRVTAADHLRSLLQLVGISTKVPDDATLLRATPKLRDWDAPKIITYLRNRVTHPRLNEPTSAISETAYQEALGLALGYLDALLIFIIMSYGEDEPDE